MRHGKKGFTLVEVIVVLVILAILAALLIPSMVGWVKKAEQKVIVADARNVYLAATAAVVEQYGLNQKAFVERAKKWEGGTRGRVTNNMLSTVQQGGKNPSADQAVDAAIAKQILEYLSSTDKNTADYKFEWSYNPQNMGVEDYYKDSRNKSKQPGVIASYTPEGKIDFIEFGHKTTLVHIDGATGKLTITENGKYSSQPN